jgi:thymidine kinase
MAKLYFYYSAMNAGKSTALLQSAHNYHERGMRTCLYTTALDRRFGDGEITSRIGISAKAHCFAPETALLDEIGQRHQAAPIDCVLIDEAQFLTRTQVYDLTEVVDRLRIPVLTFGIRTDFKGELFEGSRHLLAWSDKLVELKTVCHCGAKAIMVLRIGADGRAVQEGQQVEIGGNDRYVSVCRLHFKEQVVD